MQSSLPEALRLIENKIKRLLILGYHHESEAFSRNYHSTIIIDDYTPIPQTKGNLIILPLDGPKTIDLLGGAKTGLESVRHPDLSNHTWYDRELFLGSLRSLKAGAWGWDAVVIDGPNWSNRATILHDEILREIGRPDFWIVDDTYDPVIKSIAQYLIKRFNGKPTHFRNAICIDTRNSV